MKKRILTFLVALLFSTISISAATEYEMYFSDLNVNVKELSNGSRYKQINDYNDTNLMKVDVDANTVVYYKLQLHDDNEVTRYGEWFKLVDGNYVNYKESYEEGYKTKYEEYYNLSFIREFYVDKNKVNGSQVSNNNGQGNIKEYNITTKAGEKENIKINLGYINKNNLKYNMYNSLSIKILDGGKLKDYARLAGTRGADNKLTKVYLYEYNEKGKVEVRTESLKINLRGNTYDMQEITTFGVLTTSYENGYISEQTTSRSYDEEEEDVEVQKISYLRYKNGKVRAKEVLKNNYKNKKYYFRQYKYNSKGKLQASIIYNFKNGKKTLRKEYIYNSSSKLKSNKKSKAYRYTTNYNKQQKRTKTIRQKYNGKGKLEKKKYKVKHRKDFM